MVDVSVAGGGSFNDLQVIDGQGRPVRAQIHACMDAHNVHTSSPTANVRLFFEVRVPPMGVATYYLRRASKSDRLEKKNLVEYVMTELIEIERSSGRITSGGGGGGRGGGIRGAAGKSNEEGTVFRRRTTWFEDVDSIKIKTDVFGDGDQSTSRIILGTGRITLQFQKWSGSIQSVHRKGGTGTGNSASSASSASSSGSGQAMTRKVSQEWMRYTSSRSGAYLFRPHGSASTDRGESDRVIIAVTRGKLIQSVRYYASHVEQITTLMNINGPMGDVIHLIPSSVANMNEEVVLRWNTDIRAGGEFWTDNGAELMLRKINNGAPVPANFYPMNAGMSLREKNSNVKNGGNGGSITGRRQVMILNEHPMACASLTSDPNGASMEMMVARSLREDDGRGLAQGVHDSSRAYAPLYLLLDESVRAQSKVRKEKRRSKKEYISKELNCCFY